MIKTKLTGDGWEIWKPGPGRAKTAFTRTLSEVVRLTAEELRKLFQENILGGGFLVGSPFTPNSPFTIKKKGFDRPLVDTKDMVMSVEVRRDTDLQYFVGWTTGKNFEKASFHEIGGITAINGKVVYVPARPMVRPFVNNASMQNTAKQLFLKAAMKVGFNDFAKIVSK